MEFKRTGSTHGLRSKGGFISHVNYLGTTADRTPSHANPKKAEYYRAKARGDKQLMARDAVYLQRDIRTFSNMKGRTKADLIADERKLMQGTGRRMKSVNFILSPDPNRDKLDPNNADDVNRLEHYAEMTMHNAFNGYFVKTGKRTRTGYHKTEFKRTQGDRFYYYGVIQPDSHDSSNLHCHLTVLNYDLTNGNGINRSYYGRNHIKKTVQRTTEQWNALYPEHKMSGLNPSGKNRPRGIKPPTMEASRLINGISDVLKKPGITSQAKLIRALHADYHIQAKHLRKTRHRKHASWKFRLSRRSSWFSSTRLSSYQGGTGLSSRHIKQTLRQHLTDKMMARRRQNAIDDISFGSAVIGSASMQISSSASPAEMSLAPASSASSSSSVSSSTASSEPASMNALDKYLISSANAQNSIYDKLASESEAEASLEDSTVESHLSAVSASNRASLQAQSSIDSRNASCDSMLSVAHHSYLATLSMVSRSSAAMVSQAENLTHHPEWSNLIGRFGDLMSTKQHAEQQEATRISYIMPKLSTSKAKTYAWWGYHHAIPAYCIGYHGKIPIFDIHGRDKRWYHQLIDPVIKDFQKGKAWTLAKWRQGKDAISRLAKTGYTYRHPYDESAFVTRLDNSNSEIRWSEYDITYIARNRRFGSLYASTAEKFHDAWKSIKSKFHEDFVRPVMARFSKAKNQAESASYSRKSAESARSGAISEASSEASAAVYTAGVYSSEAVSRIRKESLSMSQFSYECTPAGESSIDMKVRIGNARYASFLSDKARTSASLSQSASLSASASASVYNSQSQWTSSAASFDYLSWSSAYLSCQDELVKSCSSKTNHYEPYRLKALKSIGSSKTDTNYSGSAGYCTPGSVGKKMNYAKRNSLEDFDYAMRVKRQSSSAERWGKYRGHHNDMGPEL